MPAPGKEAVAVYRRFRGVVTALDPAYVPEGFLVQSRNFVPTLAGTLARRPGAILHVGALSNVDTTPAIARFTHNGDTYTYLVADHAAPDPDQIWFRVNDTGGFTFAGLTAANQFATLNRPRYSIVRYGGVLFIGNGVDPIKQVPIGGEPIDLDAIGSFTSSGTAVPSSDATSYLVNGTYAYCWAVLNHSTNVWITRGQAEEITLNAVTANHIIFTPGGHSLAANERYHLFLAPVGLPLEFGHDQTPEGIDTITITNYIARSVNIDGLPTPDNTAQPRTGSELTIYRDRLIVAGDDADPQAVYGSSILFPALEQTQYRPRLFWPRNAIIRLDAPITAVGVVGRQGEDNPNNPLAIFTGSTVTLLVGDIIDDPTAQLITLCNCAGTESPKTVVRTPVGLFYLDSVNTAYIITAGGQNVDVGWPIEDVLKAIPAAQRAKCFAIFHQGFLKLWIAGPGDSDAIRGWWLDLRRGLESTPAWYGSHTELVYHAATVATDASQRAFATVLGLGVFDPDEVAVLELAQGFDDFGTVYLASLRTGLIGHETPFTEKTMTRVRLNGESGADDSISITIRADGGRDQENAPLPFPGGSGAAFGTAAFGTAEFGLTRFQLASYTLDDDRLRGRVFDVSLGQQQATEFILREVEMAALPIRRKEIP